MKKIFKFIIILLLIIGIYCFEEKFFSNTKLFTNLMTNNFTNSKKNNLILEEIENIVEKKDSNFLHILEEDNDIKVIKNINTINKINKPLIYIYSTHDKEEYSSEGLENYNLEPNVKTASYILQDMLKKYNITSIVEERSPTTAAKKDGLTYPYSYRYSKKYALEYMEKYPSLTYFIDLHRDGVSKDASTAVINDKSYAKLMFVVGTEYESSKYNLELVKKLESYINKKYPDILRKTYINKDDHYNQNINNNCFLIEVGGNHNTLDEVYNSLEIFAEALNYINEESV